MKVVKFLLIDKASSHFMLYLIAIFLPFGNLQSQSCSDLFISEIMLGVDAANALDNNLKNYAVELYNPTKGAIDLSIYTIDLTTVNNTVTTINLVGLLASKETFVVSNSQAFAPILSVSDQVSLNLNFDYVVSVKLVKGGLKVIDKIGNEGPGISLNDVDINLLNDPDYIESININLGTLKNLDLRRDALIKEGKSLFKVNALFSEWAIFSGLDFSNLGVHECACAQPVIFFTNADNYYPEADYQEGSGPHFCEVRITEPLPVDITVNINILAVGHKFVSPNVPEASLNVDYIYWTPTITDDLIWVTSTEYMDYELVYEAVYDNDPEGQEGAGVWLSILDDNHTGTTVSTTKRYFDFLISDPSTSTGGLSFTNFSIFPTIVTHNTSKIQWKTEESYKIKSVKVFHFSGRTIIEKQCEGCIDIELPDLNERGLYYIQFNTTEGLITKKILRV